MYCPTYGYIYQNYLYYCPGLQLNKTRAYVTGQYCKITDRSYYSPDYYCSSNEPNRSIPIVWADNMYCSNLISYDSLSYRCPTPPPPNPKTVYSTEQYCISTSYDYFSVNYYCPPIPSYGAPMYCKATGEYYYSGLTQLTAKPPTTHIRATTTYAHRATQPYRHARRPTTTTITWSISVQVNMRTPSTATQPAITTIIHRLTAPSSMTMLNCAQPPERPIINHSLTSVRVSPLQKSTLPTNTVRSITHTTLTRSSIANLRYRHPLLHQPLILI